MLVGNTKCDSGEPNELPTNISSFIGGMTRFPTVGSEQYNAHPYHNKYSSQPVIAIVFLQGTGGYVQSAWVPVQLPEVGQVCVGHSASDGTRK